VCTHAVSVGGRGAIASVWAGAEGWGVVRVHRMAPRSGEESSRARYREEAARIIRPLSRAAVAACRAESLGTARDRLARCLLRFTGGGDLKPSRQLSQS